MSNALAAVIQRECFKNRINILHLCSWEGRAHDSPVSVVSFLRPLPLSLHVLHSVRDYVPEEKLYSPAGESIILCLPGLTLRLPVRMWTGVTRAGDSASEQSGPCAPFTLQSSKHRCLTTVRKIRGAWSLLSRKIKLARGNLITSSLTTS